MSGLDSFVGFDDVSQSNSAESYRQFQQRMQAAAAQIQAIRASEQKQKKQEDQLIKILLKFIQSSHQASEGKIIELVSKLLGKNLPAAFILALILLNYPEIQQASGLLLPSNIKTSDTKDISNSSSQSNETLLPDLYLQKTLPLKIKLDIQAWLGELLNQTKEHQQKLRAHALTTSSQFIPEIPALAILILQEYLHSFEIYQDQTKAESFINLIFQNLALELKQTKLPDKD